MTYQSIVLGIESSCDETSAALICDGRICANAIFTQTEHAKYGGVVPEIASREHIRKIDRLSLEILSKCGITPEDLTLIAVTDSPGLAGALLVGISFALGIHSGYGIPVTGVNHLEGHIASVMLGESVPQFPFLALVASGGHTDLYKVEDFGRYELVGRTIDDAAGEAFDKVGKLLGFEYPAGRAIETEAAACTETETINFPVSKLDGCQFSFSGLKTAVRYHTERKGPEYTALNRPLICKSFQQAVIDALVKTSVSAAKDMRLERIAVVGGVACNGALRKAFAKEPGVTVFFPPALLCTDNAAMIARAGYEHYKRGLARFPRMEPTPSMKAFIKTNKGKT
jgi:N6-L-threonylcarbamoyladenine synthase